VNVYVRLTDEFNRGRIRAMICSGQAVVLHKLAIMEQGWRLAPPRGR
jgi:hypothetical protein